MYKFFLNTVIWKLSLHFLTNLCPTLLYYSGQSFSHLLQLKPFSYLITLFTQQNTLELNSRLCYLQSYNILSITKLQYQSWRKNTTTTIARSALLKSTPCPQNKPYSFHNLFLYSSKRFSHHSKIHRFFVNAFHAYICDDVRCNIFRRSAFTHIREWDTEKQLRALHTFPIHIHKHLTQIHLPW